MRRPPPWVVRRVGFLNKSEFSGCAVDQSYQRLAESVHAVGRSIGGREVQAGGGSHAIWVVAGGTSRADENRIDRITK